jgi:hypothetical protein
VTDFLSHPTQTARGGGGAYSSTGCWMDRRGRDSAMCGEPTVCDADLCAYHLALLRSWSRKEQQ